MNFLQTFKQTKFRSIIWLVLISGSLLLSVVAAIQLNWHEALTHLFLAVTFYWVDQLEMELTRRNKEIK